MKQLFPAFILIVLAFSCSQEELSYSGDAGREICSVTFTSAFVDIPATRAATPLAQGSELMVSAYSVSAGTESEAYSRLKQFTVSDALGSIVPANGQNMDLFSNSEYMFYAYSPALPFNDGSSKTISITSGTDFKIAHVQAVMGGTSQTITLPALSRKCSFTEFLIDRDPNNVTITSAAIGENGITISGITHSPADYTLGDGDIKLTDVPLDGACSIPQSEFTTVSPDNTYLGGSLVLPKADSPFSLSLDLYLNGVRNTATAVIPHMPFVPGVYYTFHVNIQDAKLVLTVAGWSMASATSDELGAGGGTITVGEWTLSMSPGSQMGIDESPVIGVREWDLTDATSDEMGFGGGTITVGEWTVITIPGSQMGIDQSPVIEVDGWVSSTSPGSQMGIDQSPAVTVNGWSANPSFSDEMGSNLTSIGITGWTQCSSGSTDMGAE